MGQDRAGASANTPGKCRRWPKGEGDAPVSTNRPCCDGRHIPLSAVRLTYTYVWQREGAMVADWIVIYAVLFVLAAGVVGRVPAEVERPRQGGCPGIATH
jgi:hypothetical protein